MATAHLGAGLATVLAGLGAGVIATLLTPIGLSLVATLRLHGLRTGPGAIRALEFNPAGEGSCRVFRAGESDGMGCRIRAQFVTRLGVVLTIVSEDRWWPRAVVIPADAASHEDFRQLRVYLRLAPPAA